MGYTRTGPKELYVWEKQAIAQLFSQTPVQNTWYTILDTTRLVRLMSVKCRQDNDETDAKDVDVRVTMDGITLSKTGQSMAHQTWGWFFLGDDVDNLNHSTSLRNFFYYSVVPGKSVKVEMRTTSALGTNPRLNGRVQYCKLVRN